MSVWRLIVFLVIVLAVLAVRTARYVWDRSGRHAALPGRPAGAAPPELAPELRGAERHLARVWAPDLVPLLTVWIIHGPDVGLRARVLRRLYRVNGIDGPDALYVLELSTGSAMLYPRSWLALTPDLVTLADDEEEDPDGLTWLFAPLAVEGSADDSR